MHWPRISIAGLIGLIAFIGLGLACLLYASSSWAGIAGAAYFAGLAIAPLGIAYRRGPRRAFWAGFAAWAWIYLLIDAIPAEPPPNRNQIQDTLFSPGEPIVPPGRTIPGPRAIVTRLFDTAYPLMILDSRQPPRLPSQRATGAYVSIAASLEKTLRLEKLAGEYVEVRIEGQDDPAPLVSKALVTQADIISGAAARAHPQASASLTLLTDAEHTQLLIEKAEDPNIRLVVGRHRPPAFPAQVATLLSRLAANPPVDRISFDEVGFALVGILAGLAGGATGRWFYTSRDREGD